MSTGTHTPRRIAWAMVAMTFVALGLIFALRSTLGMLMPTWEVNPGWSRTLVSTGGAVVLTLMAIGAPVGGNLMDRFGPRPVYVGGLVVVALGTVIGSQISAVWAFIILFCGIIGIGSGALNLPTASAAIVRLFDRNRGLATGIALAGATGGQLLLVPLLAFLVGTVGWRETYLAIAAVLALLAVAAWILFRPPRPAPGAPTGPVTTDRDDRVVARIRSLFANRTFLLMLAAFTLCGFTTAGVVDVHFMPYATACGFLPLESATAYGIHGAANMFGVVLFGWLADRFSPKHLLAGMFFLRAGSFLILMHITGDWPLLITFVVIFGLINFSTLPVIAAIMSRAVSLRMLGLALGLLFGGHSLGAAVGAVMGGWLFDLFARYDWVWNIALILALLAGVLALMVRSPEEGDAEDAGRPAEATA